MTLAGRAAPTLAGSSPTRSRSSSAELEAFKEAKARTDAMKPTSRLDTIACRCFDPASFVVASGAYR